MNVCRRKWRTVLAVWLAGLMAALSACALAEEWLPLEIDGSGTEFVFNTQTGKVTVPDCIWLEAKASRETGELSENFYMTGSHLLLFDFLEKAEVYPMQPPEPGEQDPYEAAGLELLVQHAGNSALTARLKLLPRSRGDDPESMDMVDLELTLYHHYGQPDEQKAVQNCLLKSYDVWNIIVHYTLEYSE